MDVAAKPIIENKKKMEKEENNKKMLLSNYENNIYPVLPTAPLDDANAHTTSGHVYRQQKISEI